MPTQARTSHFSEWVASLYELSLAGIALAFVWLPDFKPDEEDDEDHNEERLERILGITHPPMEEDPDDFPEP